MFDVSPFPDPQPFHVYDPFTLGLDVAAEARIDVQHFQVLNLLL
jgi:hypothetical protein